LSFGG